MSASENMFQDTLDSRELYCEQFGYSSDNLTRLLGHLRCVPNYILLFLYLNAVHFNKTQTKPNTHHNVNAFYVVWSVHHSTHSFWTVLSVNCKLYFGICIFYSSVWMHSASLHTHKIKCLVQCTNWDTLLDFKFEISKIYIETSHLNHFQPVLT